MLGMTCLVALPTQHVYFVMHVTERVSAGLSSAQAQTYAVILCASSCFLLPLTW